MALCFWKGHPYNRWIFLSSIMPIPWWVLLFVGYRSSGYVVSEKALISELPHLQVINQILTCCIRHFWTIFCWFPNFNEKCRQELDSIRANSIFPCLSCLLPNLSKNSLLQKVMELICGQCNAVVKVGALFALWVQTKQNDKGLGLLYSLTTWLLYFSAQYNFLANIDTKAVYAK